MLDGTSAMTLDKNKTIDGSNKQRTFIKDAKIGWKAIVNDPYRHLQNGVTQYDCVETLVMKLGGQARRISYPR